MLFGLPEWLVALVAVLVFLAVIVAVAAMLSEGEGALELATEAFELLD